MYVCLNIFVKQITLISPLKRGNYKTYMRAYLQGQQVEGTLRGILKGVLAKNERAYRLTA